MSTVVVTPPEIRPFHVDMPTSTTPPRACRYVACEQKQLVSDEARADFWSVREQGGS